MKTNKAFKEFKQNFEQYIATGFLIVMTLSLVLQVTSRYIFNYCLPWSEEVALLCFIMAIYFGTAAAVIKGKHLSVSFFVETVPFKVAKVFKIFGNILFFAYCFFILPGFYKLINLLNSSHAVMPITRIPKGLIYGMIPLCMMLTAFRLVQNTIKLIKTTEDEWYKKESEFGLEEEIEK